MSSINVKAVPAGTLTLADGRVMKMQDGECMWCGQYVETGRDEAGATNPLDPCWQVDGDFGCDRNPISGPDGVGDHTRPFDVARMILEETARAEREHAATVATLAQVQA